MPWDIGVVVVGVAYPSRGRDSMLLSQLVVVPSQKLPLSGLWPRVWRTATTDRLRMHTAVTVGPLSCPELHLRGIRMRSLFAWCESTMVAPFVRL